MNALSLGNLDDHLQVVRTPPDLQGDGYLVTRYDQLADGGYQPFDRLRFYFDPQGGYGYVHYLGMVDQPSEQDDTWFRPTRAEPVRDRNASHPSARESAGTSGRKHDQMPRGDGQ